MATRYLTVDQLIAINVSQDGGVGVQSRDGVERNAARPQSGFDGHETFPDHWSKAAAYLHGISSTQYFTDGNKRTAWYAAVTFLRLNGIIIPQVPDIEAEAFINAIALDAWKADGADATLLKAAEWLRSKWESEPAAASKRSWAVLAGSVQVTPGAEALYDVQQLGLAIVALPSVPNDFEMSLLIRCMWGPEDVGRSHTIDIAMEHQTSEFALIRAQQFPIRTSPPAAVGHPHHDKGIMPAYINGGVIVRFTGEGTTRIVVTIDGKLLAKVPITARVTPSIDGDYALWSEPPTWLPTT